MINQDHGYIITDLSKRLEAIEKVIAGKIKPEISDKNWDNATLMSEWQISPRTAVNYRKQGLEYFKVGGRIYYSPEQRERFIHRTSMVKIDLNNEVSGKEESNEPYN